MGNGDDGLGPQESALVLSIAREVARAYVPPGRGDLVSREDLCHFGIIGLLEARSSFDASVGTPWLAFAAIRVRGAMLDHLRKLPLVRLPQGVQKRVRELKEATRQLTARGEADDADRLAAELGWSRDEVYAMQGNVPSLVAIDDGSPFDRDDTDRGVVLVSSAADPEKRSLQAELARLVNRCLQALNAKNRLVVVGRLLEGLKLRELATSLGCTVENVRIRQKKAEGLLKECLEGHGLPVESLDEVLDC